MMKFLDDEGREGTGIGRKAVLRAHAPRPSMSGAECSCGVDWLQCIRQSDEGRMT